MYICEHLSEWWVQSSFLEARLPLPVHSNPALVLPKQDYGDWHGQLRFAAKLIAGVLDFKAKIDHGALLAEYQGGHPLCMAQYGRVFGACRVPGPKHDGLLLPPPGRRPPTHVTVVRNFQFFEVEVYNSDGTPLTVDQLHVQLQRVRAQSWKTDKEPLGLLTSDHRHTWGLAYTTLMRDRLNRESVQCIQRSLFTVCLDASVLKVSDERFPARVAAQMLHGGGSWSNSGNRWFDKALQFIVGEDGVCGVVYEQAVVDAQPVATIVDHALEYCKNPDTLRAPMTLLPLPRKLYFYITPEIKHDIERAKCNLDILITDLDISCFMFEGFGRDLLKAQGLRPDSVMQVALQLAYYSAHGSLCTTGETASLRRFHLGRMDLVRPPAAPCLALALALDAPHSSDENLLALLREAVQSQSDRTDQVLAGQGVDGHLLGLRLAAIADGQRLPELFLDPAFALATHWRLLTGQVRSRAAELLVRGPAVPDGYAVCYDLRGGRVRGSITAAACCRHTAALLLHRTLQATLARLARLLGLPGPPPPAPDS
ncbi:carnitine O-acetyltransferase [Alligator mississippiensis]|uniref:Carnitine O-acetyltransferase n=1 Tax=Alligator mississippiensis TaxID=8496 RepID=A0A151PIW2_ALLMI|nr:carnitine O-acetyltransferase [Alligator mississippiensis]